MIKTPRFHKPAIAVGSAIVLSALLGACESATPAQTPTLTGPVAVPSSTAKTTSATGPADAGASTGSDNGSSPSANSSTSALNGSHTAGSTPTPASPPNNASPPIGTGFLKPGSLPDPQVYRWTAPQFNLVNIEHPLPTVCDNALGTQVTHGVWEGDYGSGFNQITATEDIYTFASANYAAQQLALSAPKCGGVTMRTGNGFAWRSTGPQGVSHTLYVLQGNKIATLVLTMGNRDYKPALDATLLQAMAQPLSGS